MCDTGYSVKALAADLAELKDQGFDEARLLAAAPDLVKRLVLMKHNWLRARMTAPAADGGGPVRHLLHEQPDHSLAIFVVTMAPGESTPPHDHGSWAVIAGLQGREIQRRWRRTAEGGIAAAAEEAVDASTIVTLPTDAIHSLHNESDAASVTLQVYGRNPDHAPHRNFEPRRPPC